MTWRGFSASYTKLIKLLIGLVALALALACILKLRNIQRLKSEIAQWESRLSQGQEIWKSFPPLNPAERTDLERAQARLFRALPKERDIPALLQDIARLARDHGLADVSFNTADGLAAPGASGAPQPAGANPGQPPAPAAAQNSKPIEPVPVKVMAAGDYRDIAFFLEGLNKIPRLVAVQSLKVQRGFPVQSAEVIVHAYYQKGELPITAKK